MERIQSKLTATPPVPVPELETEGDDLDDGPSYASVPATTLDDSKGNSHFLFGTLDSETEAAASALALGTRLGLYEHKVTSVGNDRHHPNDPKSKPNAAATYSLGSLPRCDRATRITLFAPYRPNAH